MDEQDESTTTSTTEEVATTSTTEAPAETTTTTEAPTPSAPADLPNPDAEQAAPTTSNGPGNVASPGVDEPANSPTLNDTSQTQEERAAQARTDAMVNHAVDHGTGSEESSEEAVA